MKKYSLHKSSFLFGNWILHNINAVHYNKYFTHSTFLKVLMDISDQEPVQFVPPLPVSLQNIRLVTCWLMCQLPPHSYGLGYRRQPHCQVQFSFNSLLTSLWYSHSSYLDWRWGLRLEAICFLYTGSSDG